MYTNNSEHNSTSIHSLEQNKLTRNTSQDSLLDMDSDLSQQEFKIHIEPVFLEYNKLVKDFGEEISKFNSNTSSFENIKNNYNKNKGSINEAIIRALKFLETTLHRGLETAIRELQRSVESMDKVVEECERDKWRITELKDDIKKQKIYFDEKIKQLKNINNNKNINIELTNENQNLTKSNSDKDEEINQLKKELENKENLLNEKIVELKTANTCYRQHIEEARVTYISVIGFYDATLAILSTAGITITCATIGSFILPGVGTIIGAGVGVAGSYIANKQDSRCEIM